MDVNENTEFMKGNMEFLTNAEKLGRKHYKQKHRLQLFLVLLFTLIALAVLIVGIVLIESSRVNTNLKMCSKPLSSQSCEYSSEVKSSGFLNFLGDVQKAYFEVFPCDIRLKPGITSDEVKQKFEPYDFTETGIRKITNNSRQLLDELKNIRINANMLRPREKKALAQVKHYLQHSFGSTWFRTNYYTGFWLLGPDLFCWDRICRVGDLIDANLNFFKPRNINDLELLKTRLMLVRKGFEDYIKNLQYGVEAGMVRPIEACRGGLQAITSKYPHIANKGEKGIYDEPYIRLKLLTAEFQMHLTKEDLNEWKIKYRQSVNESLHDFALEYMGKPIQRLLSYLESDYAQHCVPSNISSGMANLPLAYVYVNGTANLSRPTTGVLSSGEKLDGKKGYEHFLSFFISTDLSPGEVLKTGQDVLDEYYPQILQIMRDVTNETNKAKARETFLKRLNQSDMYFGDPIPANESDNKAFKKCVSVESAKMFCPARWRAMQEWFKEIYQVMSMIRSKMSPLFYFTGPKRTVPSCPIQLRPSFNPAKSVSGYLESDPKCTTPATMNVPFFLARPGPKFVEWSVTAHEAQPGHHLEAQGMLELFGDSCGGVTEWLNSMTFYFAFVEGWGMYAENPLVGSDTNLYEGKPLYKYGMLTSTVWRTIRMMLDVKIHYQGLTRAEAVKEFEKYVWMPRERVNKELSRVQSLPAQAPAYMIGQQTIVKLRNYFKKELGSKFNLKDFHYNVFVHGKAPLDYLEATMKRYVSCVLNEHQEGCQLVLSPMPQPATSPSHESS